MEKERIYDSSYFNDNRASWDQRVAIHEASEFYDLKNFLSGANCLSEIELSELGDISGKRLLHLQCHFGMDTMALSRMGADCVGIDFSNSAILKAQEINKKLNLSCRFYESNVYDVLDLNLGQFDVVFTSYGTICWLPDLDRWAEMISKSLHKNGLFYFADFHPLLYLFDFNSKEIKYSYYNIFKPYTEIDQGTYADTNNATNFISHSWSHSIEEIISALLKHNLEIQVFKEFDFSPYNCFPNLKAIGSNRFCFELEHTRLPHVLLIKAIKK